MHRSFASDDVLAETALSVTGGGEILTLTPWPDAEGRHLVVIERDGELLRVRLDPRLGVAEVWLAEPALAAAA